MEDLRIIINDLSMHNVKMIYVELSKRKIKNVRNSSAYFEKWQLLL